MIPYSKGRAKQATNVASPGIKSLSITKIGQFLTYTGSYWLTFGSPHGPYDFHFNHEYNSGNNNSSETGSGNIVERRSEKKQC